MANLSEAFEEHLRSLSDTEWNDLTNRVRPSISTPPQTAGPLLPGEDRRETALGGNGSQLRPKVGQGGIDEAIRRGYIDKDGNPTGKRPR